MFSPQARLLTGISILAVPTVMYGGVTLLGILTRGAAGIPPGDLVLSETQWALFRAGHAHAGVWLLLSLVMQLLLDSATLSTGLRWLARVGAAIAPVLISVGFFGIAFYPGLRSVLYLGGASLFVATLLTGVGLLRKPSHPSAEATTLDRATSDEL